MNSLSMIIKIIYLPLRTGGAKQAEGAGLRSEAGSSPAGQDGSDKDNPSRADTLATDENRASPAEAASSRSSAHIHTHTLFHTHSHIHTRTHTHTHTHTFSLTHTHTNSLSQTLTHTHTLSLSPTPGARCLGRRRPQARPLLVGGDSVNSASFKSYPQPKPARSGLPRSMVNLPDAIKFGTFCPGLARPRRACRHARECPCPNRPPPRLPPPSRLRSAG